MIVRCPFGHTWETNKRYKGKPCPAPGCGMPLVEGAARPVTGELQLTADEHDMLAGSERCPGCGHLEVLHVEDGYRRCLVFAGGAGCSCA